MDGGHDPKNHPKQGNRGTTSASSSRTRALLSSLSHPYFQRITLAPSSQERYPAPQFVVRPMSTLR